MVGGRERVKQDPLKDKLIPNRNPPNMIRPISLDRLSNEIALAGIRRRVRRGGVVPEPDGHVHFRLLDRFELE